MAIDTRRGACSKTGLLARVFRALGPTSATCTFYARLPLSGLHPRRSHRQIAYISEELPLLPNLPVLPD